jgi:hypothetical protein
MLDTQTFFFQLSEYLTENTATMITIAKKYDSLPKRVLFPSIHAIGTQWPNPVPADQF